MNNFFKIKHGFSLMEMMVVMLIVSVVLALSAPMITKKALGSAGAGANLWTNLTGGNIGYNIQGEDRSIIIGTGATGADAAETALGTQAPRLAIHSDTVNNPHLALVYKTSGGYNYACGISFNRNLLIGNSSTTAAGSDGIVMGNSAKIDGQGSIAIGYSANTDGDFGVGVGYSATAAKNASAVGYSATAGGNSTAIGQSASASGGGIAIGQNASSSGGISIGATGASLNTVVLGTSNYTVMVPKDLSVAGTMALNNRADVEQDLDNIESDIDDLNSAVVGGDISSYTNPYSLNSRVSTLEGQVASISGKVEDIEDQIGDLDNKVSQAASAANSAGNYANLAKKYYNWARDEYSNAASKADDASSYASEAKGYRDEAKQYAEQAQDAANSVESSDRRLKSITGENSDSIDKIRTLKVYDYTFKKDPNHTPHVGIMAQDLQKVFPNAVRKGDDGYLKIRKEDMFYAMLNAVKEFDRIITKLKEQFSAALEIVNSNAEKIEELTIQVNNQQKEIDALKKEVAELRRLLKL